MLKAHRFFRARNTRSLSFYPDPACPSTQFVVVSQVLWITVTLEIFILFIPFFLASLKISLVVSVSLAVHPVQLEMSA